MPNFSDRKEMANIVFDFSHQKNNWYDMSNDYFKGDVS